MSAAGPSAAPATPSYPMLTRIPGMGASIQLPPSNDGTPAITIHFEIGGGTITLPDGRQITYSPQGAQLYPTAQPVPLVNEQVARQHGVTDSNFSTRASDSEVPDVNSEMMDVGNLDGDVDADIEDCTDVPFSDQRVLQWRTSVPRGELNAPYPAFEDQSIATESGGTHYGSPSTVLSGGSTIGAEEENSVGDETAHDRNVRYYDQLLNSEEDTTDEGATDEDAGYKGGNEEDEIDEASASSYEAHTSSSSSSATVIAPNRKTASKKHAARKNASRKNLADDSSSTSSLSSPPSSMLSTPTIVAPTRRAKQPVRSDRASHPDTTDSEPVVVPVRRKQESNIVRLKRFKRQQAEARALRSSNPSPERRPDAENNGSDLDAEFEGSLEPETETETGPASESEERSEYEPDDDAGDE
ncbi:uncharacterized protein CC84DRAFT_1200534 [Paraphaeosphaeria sporulosa]|uniref:Uncharacterized protein n=1 Tax=Paraphaeosphaeria sporulosa TaxID=1460663 RepID=A0A177CVE2_9PLEO|nr:uncharacterized protein CC84DRAFT_1200534 [Paraphaeosphaeria sporulosa]OAG11191.1 hypothetical protein CC84DRAFT_1200534 [Paraphaeosphaeria sporulosa]